MQNGLWWDDLEFGEIPLVSLPRTRVIVVRSSLGRCPLTTHWRCSGRTISGREEIVEETFQKGLFRTQLDSGIIMVF
jgi:hypothetical protein